MKICTAWVLRKKNCPFVSKRISKTICVMNWRFFHGLCMKMHVWCYNGCCPQAGDKALETQATRNCSHVIHIFVLTKFRLENDAFGFCKHSLRYKVAYQAEFCSKSFAYFTKSRQKIQNKVNSVHYFMPQSTLISAFGANAHKRRVPWYLAAAQKNK